MAARKGPREKVDGSSGSAQTSADDLGSDPSSEELHFCKELLDDGVKDAMVQDSLPVSGSAPREPSGPGTPSFPILSNVNLFLNNVYFLGFEWIEGLRKLSLSGHSGTPLSLPAPLVFADTFPGMVSQPSIAYVAIEPVIMPAMDEPSSVVLEPDPVSLPEDSCPSPPDSTDSGYFLRSCQKPSFGLGKNPSPVRRGRGRKTNLFKAHSRAREDLLGGKQISIEKALRAEAAKKKGRK